MKRKLFLILIMIAIVVTGCNYKTKNNNEDKFEKVEIEFWYGLNGYSSELMRELIEKFNQNQEHYVVVGVEQTSDEETFKALKAAIARKNPPDAVLLPNQHLQYLASKGVILSLNDFIDEENQLGDFIESYLNQNIYKNNVLGIPMYGTTRVLYYRRDFFRDNGIKAVDLLTWESLLEVSKTLTHKKEEKILVYGWELMYGTENLIDVAISNGGNFLSDDEKKITINSEEWIEAWEFFRKAIHEEKVMKVHYGGDKRNRWYATIDDVMQGRAAGYIGSSGDGGDINSETIGIYKLPSWENKLDNPKSVVNLQSLCVPIGVKDKEKDAAYQWIKFLTSADTNLMWSIKTGYLPVRKSTMDKDEFYDEIINNPDYFIPISQVRYGTKVFIDPTDGEINNLLEEAANKVLIQNINSKIALDEAQKKAQRILDEMLNQGR